MRDLFGGFPTAVIMVIVTLALLAVGIPIWAIPLVASSETRLDGIILMLIVVCDIAALCSFLVGARKWN